MKKLTVGIVVLCALAFAGAFSSRWLRGRIPQATVPTAVLRGGDIVVAGPDNTLASIAEQIADPKVFRYDPKERKAVCDGNIVVRGVLQLGEKGDPDKGETLEFDTNVCGDRALIVKPGGEFRAYHSELSTVSRKTVDGTCPLGYAIFVSGKIVMDECTLWFMSGSASRVLRSGAVARITRCKTSGGESTLSCYDVDGKDIVIEGCSFLPEGYVGFAAEGSRGEPLVIRNSRISGERADFLNMGGAKVVLIDCAVVPEKIECAQLTGYVEVKWTRTIKVVDARTGQPVAGAVVEARSAEGCGLSERVAGKTDQQGLCRLELSQVVVRKGHRGSEYGRNNKTPHDLMAFVDGRGVAKKSRLLVQGKEDPSRPIVLLAR